MSAGIVREHGGWDVPAHEVAGPWEGTTGICLCTGLARGTNRIAKSHVNLLRRLLLFPEMKPLTLREGQHESLLLPPCGVSLEMCLSLGVRSV